MERSTKGWLFALCAAAFLLPTLVLAPLGVARPGALDRGFGDDGLVIEGLGRGSGEMWPRALVVQPGGRVVVATGSRIVRFQWNGERDSGFAEQSLPATDLVAFPGGGLVRYRLH